MRERQCRPKRAATETVDVTARAFVESGLSGRLSFIVLCVSATPIPRLWLVGSNRRHLREWVVVTVVLAV
jgi:hypothetical protein